MNTLITNLTISKAAQAEIIRDYEGEMGKGSHIAETVVVPVDRNGTIVFHFVVFMV